MDVFCRAFKGGQVIIPDYLYGCLGQGPMTEMALVGKLLARDHKYDDAVIHVKNALVTLLTSGRIEMFSPGVYRLAIATPMESGEDDKPTKRMGKGELPMERLIREAKERQEAE
jgi:hypothetical protein